MWSGDGESFALHGREGEVQHGMAPLEEQRKECGSSGERACDEEGPRCSSKQTVDSLRVEPHFIICLQTC